MKTKKLVLGGVLIGVNLLLPYLFHFIPQGGKLFLPMHIGVLIAGLLLGPVYGAVIGGIAPLLGFLVNGMPQMPMAIYMMFELIAYGAVAGLLMKLFERLQLNRIAGIYLSLAGSMAVGRLVYAGVLLFSGLIKLDKAPAAITVFTSFLAGIPGIVIQLVVIPPVVIAASRLLRSGSHAAEQEAECLK